MSSKSHFIYTDAIEGYEETSEPQSIFGKIVGWNAYLIIDNTLLKSVRIKDDYLYIETKQNEVFPSKVKIWGDAVVEVIVDEGGLLLILKGGHHYTQKVVSLDFDGIAYK